MTEIAKTADQALAILLAVAERGPASATELSRVLGMNRTVVHRLLATLQQRAFVRRQGDGYVLGPVLVRLAEMVEPALRRVAMPMIRRVADEVAETVILSVPDNREVVVLEQWLGGTHLVRVQHTIGSRHPMHLGATGRALLAFLPEATIARVLRRVDNPEDVRALLEQIRTVGYSTSHDELQTGVYGTAAPICDPDGVAVATVGILVPLSRVPHDEAHGDAVVKAADDISAALFKSARLSGVGG